MQRVNLDTAAPAIKDFVRSLPIDQDDLELEIGGEVLCKVIPPGRITPAEREALVQKVLGDMKQSHERNQGLPAITVDREVRDVVDEVRSRRSS